MGAVAHRPEATDPAVMTKIGSVQQCPVLERSSGAGPLSALPHYQIRRPRRRECNAINAIPAGPLRGRAPLSAQHLLYLFRSIPSRHGAPIGYTRPPEDPPRWRACGEKSSSLCPWWSVTGIGVRNATNATAGDRQKKRPIGPDALPVLRNRFPLCSWPGSPQVHVDVDHPGATYLSLAFKTLTNTFLASSGPASDYADRARETIPFESRHVERLPVAFPAAGFDAARPSPFATGSLFFPRSIRIRLAFPDPGPSKYKHGHAHRGRGHWHRSSNHRRRAVGGGKELPSSIPTPRFHRAGAIMMTSVLRALFSMALAVRPKSVLVTRRGLGRD